MFRAWIIQPLHNHWLIQCLHVAISCATVNVSCMQFVFAENFEFKNLFLTFKVARPSAVCLSYWFQHEADWFMTCQGKNSSRLASDSARGRVFPIRKNATLQGSRAKAMGSQGIIPPNCYDKNSSSLLCRDATCMTVILIQNRDNRSYFQWTRAGLCSWWLCTTLLVDLLLAFQYGTNMTRLNTDCVYPRQLIRYSESKYW